MTTRVAIIGAGENARDHARACRKVEQAELVAICDVSREALDRFGDEFAIANRYLHQEEMLASEAPDLVVVSTWGVHHARVCSAAARSGSVRGILCEKPISMSAGECEEMITAAQEHDVILMEAFKFRHQPQFHRVQEIIKSGRVGRITAVQATLSSPLLRYVSRSNWRYDHERGGGSLLDTASYLIHMARFFLAAEPVQVFATGTFVENIDVELSTAIQLTFPGGASGTLFSSYDCGYCQSTVILGTDGWIRMEAPVDQRSVRETEFVTEGDLPAVVQVFYDSFDSEVHHFAPVNQFGLQLEHLCRCLESGEEPLISPAFSLGNMRAIDAARESMRSGLPVSV